MSRRWRVAQQSARRTLIDFTIRLSLISPIQSSVKIGLPEQIFGRGELCRAVLGLADSSDGWSVRFGWFLGWCVWLLGVCVAP